MMSELRNDGKTYKGQGWLGPIKRPDGELSTELTMSWRDVLGGTDIPLLVPTLTQEEIDSLMSVHPSKIPTLPNFKSIQNKAIQHAYDRDKQGLSPFKD